jgi:hypothetical protein
MFCVIILVGDCMKHILNFLKSVLLFVWIVIAIFTTICLLSYNKYNVTAFGDTSLLIIDNNDLEPTFLKNDLAVVTRDGASKFAVGDKVFFYYGNITTESYINFGEITEVTTDAKAETSYSVNGTKVSYSSLIGKANGAKVYHKVGLLLSIFESRWGYMFLVILPTLFILVYEIYSIVEEVKKETKKELDE